MGCGGGGGGSQSAGQQPDSLNGMSFPASFFTRLSKPRVGLQRHASSIASVAFKKETLHGSSKPGVYWLRVSRSPPCLMNTSFIGSWAEVDGFRPINP